MATTSYPWDIQGAANASATYSQAIFTNQPLRQPVAIDNATVENGGSANALMPVVKTAVRDGMKGIVCQLGARFYRNGEIGTSRSGGPLILWPQRERSSVAQQDPAGRSRC